MTEPRKTVRALRISGYVMGACAVCGKEQRALVMFEDYAWGVECLDCGHTERVDDVEYVEDAS
ncbi:MAG TPA: hypothetical protein VGR51_02620 [Thermoplasmata archaeon]|jgi:Zn ribbon nucleic-acid-binding protein|nr:hypothetical protein [Thermoplasmata archaeon]